MGLGSIVKKATSAISSAADWYKESGLSDAVSAFGNVSDALSPYIKGGLSYMGQQSANAANAAEAEKQRQWQERMRATQYQTAVKDMIAAGLNPMLAYQQGGAGTPSGAVSAAYQNSLGQGVSSALASRSAIAQVKNLEETNKLIPAQVQQTLDSARFLRQQTATEIAKEYRETQAAQIDRERMDLDRSMAGVMAALQHAQARNYDVNSGLAAQRTYQEGLDTPRLQSDYEARKSPGGRFTRQAGTMISDLGQILNFFRGK